MEDGVAFMPNDELLEFALDYEMMLVNTNDPVDGIRAIRQSATAVSQYWLESIMNEYPRLSRSSWWLRGEYHRNALALARKLLEMTRRK